MLASLTGFRRSSAQILVVVAVALATASYSFWRFQQSAIEHQRDRLREIAHGRAARIELALLEVTDRPDREATVRQLRSALENAGRFGATGELLVATRDGNDVVFLLSQCNGRFLNLPSPMPWGSKYTAAMRRALSGETGTSDAVDYRGQPVLAAFQPLADSSLGLVAKVDLAEIRQGVLGSTLAAIVGPVVFVLLGVFVLQHTASGRRGRDERTERYRALFDGFHSGALLISDVVVDCNREACRLWGCSREELVGRPASEIVVPDNGMTLDEILTERIDGGQPPVRRFAAQIPRCDGRRADLDVGLSTLYLGDDELLLITASDVSAWNEAPRAVVDSREQVRRLRQEQDVLSERVAERARELAALNDQLSQASRTKDEFLANMSHELRTPLSAILSFSESLLEEVYGRLSSRQRQALNLLLDSARHLLSLISDILDVSKIEAGRIELDKSPVDIRDVCEASLALVREAAVKKDLRIDSRFNPEVSLIRADARRLKQILVNLLSNAVKFTESGGQVALEVRCDDGFETVTFEVADTGIGIAPEDMGRLFQPFVQLDSGLDRQFEGTGLGLVLVSRLTDLHGGSVEVESSPGEGSRFKVTLPGPMHLPHRGGPEESAWCLPRPTMTPTRFAGRPPRLLLADDNEANVISQADYLEACGYQVQVARDGQEAIRRAQEQSPELILMDIQMPRMDGLEAIRRLRGDAQLAKVPIVALTGLAMPGDRERCLSAGADSYLSKPLKLKVLTRTIEELLNNGYHPTP